MFSSHDHTSTEWPDARPPRPWGQRAAMTFASLGSVVARDGVLTVVVLVVTLGLFALVLGTEDLTVGPVQGVVLVVAACLQALPLVLRRVRPVLALGLVVAFQTIIVAASPPDLSVGGIPTLIVAYTVGTLLPTRRALTFAGAAAPVGAMAAAVTAVVWGHDPLMPFVNHLAAGVVLYVVSAFVGTTVATRRSNASLIRLRAAELVRTQQAQTRAAIFAERSRMARELHDVAAHHLSGLVVQAAAVERQIDSDPERAKEGTAWIRAQGKETLDSLRLIVGVLRERPGADGEQGADAHDAPPPGLGALEGLVRTARTLGDTVELVREGRARDLSPIADAAFYRVAQESLSNARQHAPEAPVRVTVRFDEREVSLEVVNEPAPGGTRSDPSRQGMGLIGMRERAQLVGATLITGAVQSGGWRVLLTLPVHHG
jgi:signal transduction histidine kinase